MFRILIFSSLLLFPSLSWSQVINTEKLREKASEKGWAGEVAATFGLARNKAGQTISLGTRANIHHDKKKHRWMLFGGYNLVQFQDKTKPDAQSTTFANNGFSHLRYNYKIGKLLTWEAFSQMQFDEVQEMRLRLLQGTGPRFRLIDNDSLDFFIGTLGMYEYETVVDVPASNAEEEVLIFNRDFRLSLYTSVGWEITDVFSVRHITYFQPNIDKWSDFRISSETTLQIDITDRLSFNSYFQLLYDAAPPATVPETMFNLRNGLALNF